MDLWSAGVMPASGGGNWAAQYLQRDAWHFEPGIAEGCCDDSSVEDQL